MKNYLTTVPLTRINDEFIKENSDIVCTSVGNNYIDPIVTGGPNIDHRWQADFYKKIGVDIVTETAFNYPYPFITEKTYRPIASLRPFIIVGPVRTLDFLKQVGFKTFSAIIDESYDNIEDPEKRFIEVCCCIKLFVSRPIRQIQQDLHNIKDVLLHNQNHLYNLIDLELTKFQQALNDTN